MASEPGVVDISSDEEDFAMDKLGVQRSWFSECFDDGFVAGIGGSDEVILVNELSAPAVKQKDADLLGAENSDDSDDDCRILDSDPDKPAVFAGGKYSREDGGDELVIVGEKGQLACRDYPHPRHLCVNFPFVSSPHEKHCSLCHCYVCDSPAPCKYWGNGRSMFDHCHSTDKELNWESLRQSFKQKNMASSQRQKLHDVLQSGIAGSQNPVSVNRPNFAQSLASTHRLSTLQPCLAPSITNTTQINQWQHQRRPIFTSRSQRPGPYPTMSHQLNPGTQFKQRHNSGALASEITPSTRFRKTRTMNSGVNSLSTNQSHNTVPSNSQILNCVLEKSHSAKETSQSYQHPGIHLQKSQSLLLKSTAVDSTQMRSAPLRSYSTPARMPTSECHPLPLMVDYSKSWQDILALVESNLEMPCSNSGNITNAQQPHAVSPQPLPYTREFSQELANTDITYAQSNPVIGEISSLNNCYTWFSSKTGQELQEHGQGEDSQLSIAHSSDPKVVESNPDFGSNSFNTVLAAVEQELVEPVKEAEISAINPSVLPFDFDVPWSTLAQV